MRIKKLSILEAAANATVTNTSNTTDVNQQKNKSTLIKPEDIEKSKKALEDLEKKEEKINKDIKDGPMGAFLKVSENNNPGTGEDFGDLGSSDIENLADRDEKNKKDYNDWLNSVGGQDYMDNLLSIDEATKNKRKVIKTIKVKDLK
jgi:hypothetical protein